MGLARCLMSCASDVHLDIVLEERQSALTTDTDGQGAKHDRQRRLLE